ncbi:WD repeat-containing protein 73 [Scomber japonicus]|uniref:WD repeat-containing protein 73 n=1 Tax=Scomber japonicus TaxID=13676 RepID=UPI002305E1E7|nr:WD repeat-containing protein 73 [Scomber japonicus]
MKEGMKAGMEDSEFEDVLDDWFIESLKTYKDLHVYQLEGPTQVIEWTSGKTVCVAGYRQSKNEMLELRLPLKLLADENKGLCAERDFKVIHGGFTDGPVRSLKHIPGTRCVVTNDGLNSDLQLWQLGGDDSDVIRRTGSVKGRKRRSEEEEEQRGRGSMMAARLWSQSEVLHGGRSDEVQLTDLESGRTLYTLATDSADPLSSLQFLSDNVFLAGCSNGNVYVADIRSPAAPQLSPPPAPPAGGDVLWWSDASAGSEPAGCRLLQLSACGQAVVSDLRSLGGGAAVVSRARLDVGTRRCGLDDVRVSWAPALNDCVSVSGFSGSVQIYDASVWSSEQQQEVEPLFEHRGHSVSSQRSDDDDASVFITAHVWHPERPRTLLSAASDGSVHVWDWVDRSAAGGC